ncbi:MAG: hypothetical protein LBD17_00830 [Endomicrobium sp.]|jgi:hypothetical protein|nr:hypothetical protein [Endomicrobium sp.]
MLSDYIKNKIKECIDGSTHSVIKELDNEILLMNCSLHGEYKTTVRNIRISHIHGCHKCRVESRKAVCKEKYGEDWTNSKLAKQTKLKKYGSETYVNPEKAKQTSLKRYGVSNPAKYEKIKEKIINTNLRKYGKKSALAIPEIRNKRNKIVYEKLIVERSDQNHINEVIKRINNGLVYTVIDTSPNKEDQRIVDYNIRCNSCKKMFTWNEFIYTHTRTHQAPYCHNCEGHFSKEEKYVVEYIKSIYSGQIIENNRDILFGRELDIYLPDLKIAIEYNGMFWHGFHKYSRAPLAEVKKDIEVKRKMCKIQGIRLINIDDCDWNDRPDVFKRFLQDQLLPRIKIGARNCIIKDISSKLAKEFCEYYHVNGYRRGSTRLGLYYKDELLVVALFAKYRNNYECVRLCYKTGYDIIGGWTKIQKHFGKRFLHYVNLKYFQGENKTGIGYRFVIKKSNKILHRNSLQKKTRLLHYCENYNPILSDFQNCIENDMIAVFDQGNDIRWYN